MKAETLKQFLLKKYPTNEYFDCPVPKHYWEVIQEYADHYARIQIDKDRKRIKEAYYSDTDFGDFNNLLKSTKINLEP